MINVNQLKQNTNAVIKMIKRDAWLVKHSPLTLKGVILNKIAMYPRAKKFGIFQYYTSKAFRTKCKNRSRHKRQKETYGSGFMSKRKKIKKRLFARDGNICFWCGKSMTKENATIEHIVPASKKRNNNLSNLRLIHEECRVERDKIIEKLKHKFKIKNPNLII